MLFDLAVFAVGIVFGMGAGHAIYQTYMLEKADRYCRTPLRIGDKFFYLITEQEYIEQLHTQPKSQGCELPPAGWYCSREKGHEGPCAPYPVERAT